MPKRNVPKKYIPDRLSKKDKGQQEKQLKKSANYTKRANILHAKK